MLPEITFFANKSHSKSERQFKCAQIFASEFNFVHVIPMRSKANVPQALKQFFKIFGVPEAIICDSAPEQIYGDSKRLCMQVDCQIKPLEPYTPWANRAELHVGAFHLDVAELFHVLRGDWSFRYLEPC